MILLFIKPFENLLIAAVILHQGHITLRHERGDSMLVHHLLTAVAVNHDGKIVKSFDRSTDLKAVCKVYRGRNVLFAQLVQERVLDVNGLVH